MDTYTESEFSDPCFIVAGTQSKDGSNDKQGNGYGVTKLKALNCVEGTCPSPERADSPVIPLQAPIDMILKGKGGPCVVTAANGDDSVKKTGNSAGQSSQTGSHTSSSGSVSGTASDRAPGGGGGGDGRDEDEHDHIRNGSHGDVEVDDEEEEEEEQGLGRNNLLPPLNHPSGHILVGGESSHESDVDRARPAILASDTATDTTIPETVSESEGGGISDAPTVVVSDTEGHGQRFSTSVSPAFAGLVPSPATGRFVPERECSSVENTSTLSSITSCYSSSDDQRAADGVSKKRGPGKWSLASNEQFLYQGGISRKIYTSSDTSPEKSQNQRTTIRKEKLIRTSGTSLLLSKESQGASQAGVAERENFISSQQDLFHETETAPPSTEDQIIGTPAETIGSLQFSQTHLVPETLEDSQSLNYIPPSPDAYGSAPLIVPDSPTADVKVHFEESDHNETPEIVDVIPAPEKDEDKKHQSSSNSSAASGKGSSDNSGKLQRTSTLDETHRRVVSRPLLDGNKSSTSDESIKSKTSLKQWQSSGPVSESDSYDVQAYRTLDEEPCMSEDIFHPSVARKEDTPCSNFENASKKQSTTPTKLFKNDKVEQSSTPTKQSGLSGTPAKRQRKDIELVPDSQRKSCDPVESSESDLNLHYTATLGTEKDDSETICDPNKKAKEQGKSQVADDEDGWSLHLTPTQGGHSEVIRQSQGRPHSQRNAWKASSENTSSDVIQETPERIEVEKSLLGGGENNSNMADTESQNMQGPTPTFTISRPRISDQSSENGTCSEKSLSIFSKVKQTREAKVATLQSMEPTSTESESEDPFDCTSPKKSPKKSWRKLSKNQTPKKRKLGKFQADAQADKKQEDTGGEKIEKSAKQKRKMTNDDSQENSEVVPSPKRQRRPVTSESQDQVPADRTTPMSECGIIDNSTLVGNRDIGVESMCTSDKALTQSYVWESAMADKNNKDGGHAGDDQTSANQENPDLRNDSNETQTLSIREEDPFEFRASQSQRERQTLQEIVTMRETRRKQKKISTKSTGKPREQPLPGTSGGGTGPPDQPGPSGHGTKPADDGSRKRKHDGSESERDGGSGSGGGGQDQNGKGNQDGSDQGPPRKVRRTVEEKLKMTNTVVVCRRITEEVLIGDKVVDRKQWQEEGEPTTHTYYVTPSGATAVTRIVSPSPPDSLSPPSLSRNVSSLTSGDLADVSSLSKTTSTSTVGSSRGRGSGPFSSPNSSGPDGGGGGTLDRTESNLDQFDSVPPGGSSAPPDEPSKGKSSDRQNSGKQTRLSKHKSVDTLTPVREHVENAMLQVEPEPEHGDIANSSRQPGDDSVNPVETPDTVRQTGTSKIISRADSLINTPGMPSGLSSIDHSLDKTLSIEKSPNRSSSSITSLKHSESLFTSPDLSKKSTSSTNMSMVTTQSTETSPSRLAQPCFTNPQESRPVASCSNDGVFTKPAEYTSIRIRKLGNEKTTEQSKDTRTEIPGDKNERQNNTQSIENPNGVSRASTVTSESIDNQSRDKLGDNSDKSNKTSTKKPKEKKGKKNTLPSSKTNSKEKSANKPPETAKQSNIRTTTLTEGAHGLTDTALETETRVLAKWKDGFYYSGQFIYQEKKGKYLVQFDDGDSLSVKPCNVIVCAVLPRGTSVMALTSDDFLYPGIICNSDEKQGEVNYEVELDEKQTKMKLPRSKIILTQDRAACLMDEIGEKRLIASPKPVVENTGNVSLDNLIEGKRRRTPDNKIIDKPSEPSTSSGVKSKLSTSSSSRKSSTKKGQKHQLSDITPLSTSTPTPTRVLSRRNKEKATTSTLLPHVVLSPDVPRRSPRKSRADLFKDVKGPIPADGCTIFEGCVFLLTHAPKHEGDQLAEKKLLHDMLDMSSSTDESALVDEQECVPFDKHHLKAQIEAGGGVVLEKFSSDEMKKFQKVFLLSDTYQRTIKYLQCLAAAIPCVSHIWVRDCCRRNVYLDPKAYLLPAGISTESARVMEWSKKSNILAKLRVLLVSTSKEFRDAWSVVLETAGAQVTIKLPGQLSANVVGKCEVIVTDCSFPAKHIKTAKSYQVPVVSTEWVIQSLINGKLMNYYGHEKYKYNYTSM